MAAAPKLIVYGIMEEWESIDPVEHRYAGLDGACHARYPDSGCRPHPGGDQGHLSAPRSVGAPGKDLGSLIYLKPCELKVVQRPSLHAQGPCRSNDLVSSGVMH